LEALENIDSNIQNWKKSDISLDEISNDFRKIEKKKKKTILIDQDECEDPDQPTFDPIIKTPRNDQPITPIAKK
jgi:hypothetical protein